VTARRRAYACQVVAALCLAAALVAVPQGALYAIPGIVGAVLLAWAATRYRAEHRELLARHEQARRAAVVIPDPRPPADGTPLTGHERAAWARLVATYHLTDRDPRSTP
jgi:hypothetical protein